MGKAYLSKSETPDGNGIEGFSVDTVKQIMKARVNGSPIETGQTSYDNKVLDPFDLIISGTIVIDDDGKWKKTIRTLKEMFANRNFSFYSASDGFNFYEKLIMIECPIERDVSKYDLFSLDIKLTQAMLVQASSKKPSNSEDSDTRALGYVAGV